MRAVAESGGGMTAASAIHVNIFGLNPVVVFGSSEQKQRMLPPIRDGKQKACFAVTEPNTGLNTTQLKTRAVDQGDHYLVNGQKVWISTAQIADKIMLLARTTRLEEVRKPSEGLSLFYTDLDRSAISIREIRKMGRKAIDSNELFMVDWRIPKHDLIGEEGRGFEYILHGMNPEASAARGRGGRHRRLSGPDCRHLCQGAYRLQSADRTEPIHSTSAGEMLDGARSGMADDSVRSLSL